MNRRYLLYEDELPPKLPATFSSTLRVRIKRISKYNRNRNPEGVSKWLKYLEQIKGYISQRSICFNWRYPKMRNGGTFVSDYGFNVGFFIFTNTGKALVNIFMLNLNLDEYGLVDPTNHNNQNNSGTPTIIKETTLRRIIRRVLRETLSK